MQIPERLRPPEGNTTLIAAFNELEQTRLVANQKSAKVPKKKSEMEREKLQLAIWDGWKFNSLREYATLALSESDKVLPTLEANCKAVYAAADKRINRLGCAFGTLIKDNDAGQDLALLLGRMGGGLLDSAALHAATCIRDRWSLLAEACRSILAEPIPTPKPTEKPERQLLLATLAQTTTEEENK